MADCKRCKRLERELNELMRKYSEKIRRVSELEGQKYMKSLP